ncbi:MAG: hypothetical protein KI792_10750 [Alphaproteobacteria bacterium]|nr:hypothetical protein [Alphaproteobacteria bacterium SS10]
MSATSDTETGITNEQLAQRLFLALCLLEVLIILLRLSPSTGEFASAALRPIGGAGLLILTALAMPMAGRSALLVGTLAAGFCLAILLTGGAGVESLIDGLARALLFAGFLPALYLLRATADRQSRVRLSRRRLAALPAGRRADGITLGSHGFGAVLNTGSFPIMSAVVPADADLQERRRFGLAALRGMNLAPLWSPFFVAMALASSYLPDTALIQIAPVGLVIAALSLTVSITLFGRVKGFHWGWLDGLKALVPVAGLLASLGAAVVATSTLTPLSTLEVIVLAVPPLCMALMMGRTGGARLVLTQTYKRMGSGFDDLIIVVAAMTLAAMAAELTFAGDIIRDHIGSQPVPLAILGLILLCALPSLLGLHPMIPTAVMLAAMTAEGPSIGLAPLNDLVLMGAALTAWSAGTMCSVSSLSVAVCAGLFRVPAWRLMASPNLAFAGLVILIATAVLSAVQFLLS